MKKKIIMLIALLLAFSTLFIACGNASGNNDETGADTTAKAEESTSEVKEETTVKEEEITEAATTAPTTEAATTEPATTDTATTEAETTEPAEDLTKPYTAVETLMSEEVSKELYETFTTSRSASCIYPGYPMSEISTITLGNLDVMKDCRILSVTIPVQKTTTLDSDGNFIFTIYVFNSTFKGLAKAAKETYEIKINAAEYGLGKNKNNVKQIIKVDLTSYNITLSGNETLGFYSENDTLLMAMCKDTTSWGTNNTSNPVQQIIREKASHLAGIYNKVGTTNYTYSHASLMLDFEWEKTYATKAEYLALNDTTSYDAMIAELKAKYSGKYVSVLGDSISTFNTVSNDRNANADIANNEPYYPYCNGNICDYTLMYWGKVIDTLDMKVGVINSWSGSQAYGRWDDLGKNMLVRSGELHRDNGTPTNTSDDIAPDVIIVYMGINDLNGGIDIDMDLWNDIKNGYDQGKVDTWFKAVLDQANKAGSDVVKGTTYKNFAQVYALSINNMRQKYPNAEIYCLTYQENNHANTTADRFQKYNGTVKAIAEYFGATIVDQSLDSITSDNCHSYAGDMSSLHPNAAGHAIMADNIMSNMYARSKK